MSILEKEGEAIELSSRILDSSAWDMERFASDSVSRYNLVRAEFCKFLFVLYRSIENSTRFVLFNNKLILQNLKTFKTIHELLEKNDKLLVFLTKAEHKIKKKAEQMACENAIKLIEKFN